MAKLSRDLSTGNLHPRENIAGAGTLGALNAEIVINADGVSSVSLDLRGTFSLTVEVSGTVDGSNWTLIPMRPLTGGQYVPNIAGTAVGIWQGSAAGFAKIRARVTAYTSGAATAALLAATGLLDDRLLGETSPLCVTGTAATGVALTLTLAAPGAGLRQYITGIYLERHASGLLTAGATPVVLTTTNLPGALAFSIPFEAAAQGSVYEKRFEPPRALVASAQNTAVTIVAALQTGVIWRFTATYYVAP